ncbi:MAG TPA: TetR family transcriptional regulator [Acidimicrobiia bacterium]|nr:TetR family transcriptional regulator [Acidimicrobiia bacterium]
MTPTRERMILAAERLFAERGVSGVSLREIGAEAGQRNNSAAQYHFGSKQGLVDAIAEYRMGPINEQRLAQLDELDRSGRGHDLRGLVEALVEPFAELACGDAPTWYARFLEQTMADPDVVLFGTLTRPEMRGLREAVERIERALDELPAPLRGQRLALAGSLVVRAVADHERARHRRGPRARPVAAALFVSDLVDATVGLLTAPVSVETRRELRAANRRHA